MTQAALQSMLDNTDPSALYQQVQRELAEMSLHDYIQQAWPTMEPGKEFVDGWHIQAIAEHLEAVYTGEIRRLLINIPPRHMKSLGVSVSFPTWVWIQNPTIQFLAASYAGPLAVRDNLKCRRLIQSKWYQERWGHKFELTGDQNQKGRYENDKSGYRLATSVGGALTGEGGDIIMIDDPHNVAETESSVTREGVLEWWDHAMQSRLNNPKTGAFIVIMQRIHERDLSGHIIKEEYENWDHLVLPAEYEKKFPFPVKSSLGFKDPRKVEGQLLWPDQFDKESLDRLKNSMGTYASAGQLQQRPSPKGGGILRASWWQCWDEQDQEGNLLLPEFDYILQSWDTAYSEKDDNSFSARTTWGVFEHKGHLNCMILEMWRDHVPYPTLRRLAKESYLEWQPDAVLIEKKASGQSLIQDLRMANIPCIEYSPDRDKVARAHSSSALLESGMVWHPNRRWADTLIEKCAIFPAGDGADLVDTCTQAWIRLRNMWLLPHPEDDDGDAALSVKRVKKPLYG